MYSVLSDVLLWLNVFVSAVFKFEPGFIFILDVVNSLLSALGVYEDLGKDAKSFSREHPFACWLSVVVNFFAGGILANFLLGEPILAFLNDPIQILNVYALTFAWLFVFHSPNNMGYSLIQWTPVKVMLSVMKEIYRSYKVHGGVSQVGKLYQTAQYNHLLMVIIGTIKGNGAAFLMIIVRLIRGVWDPKTEMLRPSITTKMCFLAAILYVLNVKTNTISLPHDYLIPIIAIIFVLCKLKSIHGGTFDPFIPVEKAFAVLFLNGTWDSPIVIEQKKKKNRKSQKGE